MPPRLLAHGTFCNKALVAFFYMHIFHDLTKKECTVNATVEIFNWDMVVGIIAFRRQYIN